VGLAIKDHRQKGEGDHGYHDEERDSDPYNFELFLVAKHGIVDIPYQKQCGNSMWDYIKNSLGIHLGLLVLIGVVGYGSARLAYQTVSIWREVGTNRKQIEALSRKKLELEQYLARIQTQEAFEREAKARLNMKLPGEKVVVVPRGEEQDEAAVVSREVYTPMGVWGRVVSFLWNLLRISP